MTDLSVPSAVSGQYTRPMKVVASNRRARFDYEILDTLEAGIMLTGSEAKSCRMGRISLAGAYVSFRGSVPILRHATIAKYPFTTDPSYEPERDRPLLLKKREAEKLRALSAEKGVTIIPLEVHAAAFIKLRLGVARGRKTIDKRKVIKEREVKRKLREGREV